mmetsp:Transcript_56823/g.122874  ORF Transcript_56823/g.122874 Transcript_56823/m.122874 type:complete len:213 (+) Transcript_56823:270-908(+)
MPDFSCHWNVSASYGVSSLLRSQHWSIHRPMQDAWKLCLQLSCRTVSPSRIGDKQIAQSSSKSCSSSRNCTGWQRFSSFPAEYDQNISGTLPISMLAPASETRRRHILRASVQSGPPNLIAFMSVMRMQKEWAEAPNRNAILDIAGTSSFATFRNTDRSRDMTSVQSGWTRASQEDPSCSCNSASARASAAMREAGPTGERGKVSLPKSRRH